MIYTHTDEIFRRGIQITHKVYCCYFIITFAAAAAIEIIAKADGPVIIYQ